MNKNYVREYYQAIKNKIIQARFDSAIASADKLLQNYPNDEHGHYYKGVCEFAIEKYDFAIKSYSTAIKLNPAYAKAYFNLGICYYELKKYDFALINIGKALVIFSKRRELDKKNRCIQALNIIKTKTKLKEINIVFIL